MLHIVEMVRDLFSPKPDEESEAILAAHAENAYELDTARDQFRHQLSELQEAMQGIKNGRSGR